MKCDSDGESWRYWRKLTLVKRLPGPDNQDGGGGTYTTATIKIGLSPKLTLTVNSTP